MGILGFSPLERAISHRRIAKSIKVIVHANGDIQTKAIPLFAGREYSNLTQKVMPKSLWAFIFTDGKGNIDVAAVADIWTIDQGRYSIEVARMDATEQEVIIDITGERHIFPVVSGAPPQEGIGYFYTEVTL